MSDDRRSGDGLRAAAAAVNITPALGCAQAGYGNRDRYADDVADDLYSKVLALECGGVEAVIVTNDLIGIPRELGGKIRKLVHEATGVPEDHVLVCASHTHFGPVVEDVTYFAEEMDGRADRAWIDLLTRKIAGAAAMARRRVRPARGSPLRRRDPSGTVA